MKVENMVYIYVNTTSGLELFLIMINEYFFYIFKVNQYNTIYHIYVYIKYITYLYFQGKITPKK